MEVAGQKFTQVKEEPKPTFRELRENKRKPNTRNVTPMKGARYES